MARTAFGAAFRRRAVGLAFRLGAAALVAGATAAPAGAQRAPFGANDNDGVAEQGEVYSSGMRGGSDEPLAGATVTPSGVGPGYRAMPGRAQVQRGETGDPLAGSGGDAGLAGLPRSGMPGDPNNPQIRGNST